MVVTDWYLTPSLKPDIFEVECLKKKTLVTFIDGKDSINFTVKQGKIIDFSILKNGLDTAHTRIVGIQPNVNFTKKYITENKGKVFVEIPEVSELVNIVMALHKDAERDNNMFDTKTHYYQKVKNYFEPYRTHQIIDTIQKYINGLRDIEGVKHQLFSDPSYAFYYAFKMNACVYRFDKNGSIINEGYIKKVVNGWQPDPMLYKDLLADFAQKSNYRKFYQDNKPYYDSLLENYNKLAPIQKMQQWLNKKFGWLGGNYRIYFSPLIGGAHSTQGFMNNNFQQSFKFVARADYSDEYTPIVNEFLESRVVFTEIDHNYVGPISYKYANEINNVFAKRDIWANGDLTNMYPNPVKVFDEYMTWALFTLYIDDNYNKDDIAIYLPKLEDKMYQRGYVKFKEFNRALWDKYQQDRSISMDKLYQYILEWAKNESN